MKIKLDQNGMMPERKHRTDAGLDLKAAEDAYIPPQGSALVRTGVHVQLPHGTVGLIRSRSGMMKYGVTTDGTIDEGFTGEIRIELFNHSGISYDVHRGDRIAQLVITPTYYFDLELVGEPDESDRGADGYGSTGK